MANSPFIYGANGATSLVPGGVNLPGSTSGTLQFQPNASTTSYTVTMPAAQGAANTVPLNDGSGNLSWTSFSSSSPTQSYELYNLGLSTSVGSNALTINLKQADGSTDPASGTGAVSIGFRSSTASSGAYNIRNVNAALSITVPSGATLGQTSAVDQYVWVYALDNAGTVELAVSGVSLFPNNSIQSSTTIGAGSTSGTTLYSTTGRSNVPIRLIARLLVNETTAGTWASNTTDVVLAPTPYPNNTDWVSYTPTFVGLGAPSAVHFWSRRAGDSLEINGILTQGTATGVANQMTIGFNGSNANVTIDSNKVSSTMICGDATISVVNAASYSMLMTGGNTFIQLSVQSASLAGTNPLVGGVGTGTVITFFARVPIVGWSNFGP